MVPLTPRSSPAVCSSFSDLGGVAFDEQANLSGEVHVWTAALSEIPPEGRQGLVRDYAALLSPEERHRADRFAFRHLRETFVIAHGLLRRLLAEYLSGYPVGDLATTRAADIPILQGAYGKPYVPGGGRISFNLSHSGELICCAISRGAGEVGVDVERVRPMGDLLSLAGRFFAPEERAELADLPPSQREQAFFRCWTRKEAFIKATGEGLHRPLDSFVVPVSGHGRLGVREREQGCGRSEAWQLHSFEPRRGFAGAVVVPGTTRGVRFRAADLDLTKPISI